MPDRTEFPFSLEHRQHLAEVATHGERQAQAERHDILIRRRFLLELRRAQEKVTHAEDEELRGSMGSARGVQVAKEQAERLRTFDHPAVAPYADALGRAIAGRAGPAADALDKNGSHKPASPSAPADATSATDSTRSSDAVAAPRPRRKPQSAPNGTDSPPIDTERKKP